MYKRQALPNLIALICLSGVVVRITKGMEEEHVLKK